MLPVSVLNFARFVLQDAYVTITSPAQGGTITTAAAVFTWDVFGGVQTTYRLRVWSDAAQTVLVYDSGVVISADATATVPAGILTSGVTYYATVALTLDDGSAITSGLRTFSTLFAATGTVSQTLRPIGGCVDPEALPGFRIRWSLTLGAGETFVRWNVLKREGGTMAWTIVFTSTTQADNTYTDYLIRSGATYQYQVQYLATFAGGTVVSAAPSPLLIGANLFDFHFLHVIGDESTFARVDSWEQQVKSDNDVSLAQVWGRLTPVAQIGEKLAHTIALTVLPERSYPRHIGARLEEMLAAQQANGAILCLRLGRTRELYPGVILPVSRRNTQKQTGISFSFAETAYDESVV